MTTEVLGGFVKTYYFDEESNANVIDGTMTIEYDLEQVEVYPITVVVLENKDNSSEIGDRIVAHTEELSGYDGDLIVKAYFSAFCHKIQKYIVAYERFIPSSIPGIRNQPFFSADGQGLDLTESWRQRMRSFIKLLHYAAKCKIRHGSLSDPNSYVTCREDLRIINVGRILQRQYKEEEKYDGKDMKDLMHLISRVFPTSLTKYEWVSLKNLLVSETMSDPARVHNFCRIALRHPVLLGTVEEKLECFVTLHRDVMKLDDALGQKARFSNRIHRDYPGLRVFFSFDYKDKVRSDYEFRIQGHVPWNHVYYKLFTFPHSSNLELIVDYGYDEGNAMYPMNEFLYDHQKETWSPRYGERYIYINIIRLVENLIKHGVEYNEYFRNLNNVFAEIKTLFRHVMCACYTVLNMKEDWINEQSHEPYDCKI